MSDLAFGIDIGGSGIKGAPVDLVAGEYADKRTRIPTPQPSTPQAVADVLAKLVDTYHLADDVPIGVAFPAPMQHGVVRSMANLDQSWTGVDLPALVRRATGRHAVAVNDADAAGVGEVRYGAARDSDGVVLVVTLGTGIGSALVVDGVLVPNTERGTWRSTGTTPSPARRTPRASARTCPGTNGPSACSATSVWSRTCCPPTSSSWGVV